MNQLEHQRVYIKGGIVSRIMRLLHVEGDPLSDEPLSITLCEKIGTDVPGYMILSHRWREGEVLFADIRTPDPSVARNLPGWAKVETSCRQALQMGLRYVWVDTCCIDKSSSAELSEAINSMYQYYARSNICFAYLDDVDDDIQESQSLKGSCWFTRGWTLQELIAPRNLNVYSKNWKLLGDKESLSAELAEASKVAEPLLWNPARLDTYSVAQKFSWAAWRQTTREEDESYCLLGLFGVNMSPIYGEGRERAFRRLQTEIMRVTHDHTLFVWNPNRSTGGMLASSPRDFISPYSYKQMAIEVYCSIFGLLQYQNFKPDYVMTNVGLDIVLPIASLPEKITGRTGLCLGFLACQCIETSAYVAVCFQKSESVGFPRFYRFCLWGSSVVRIQSQSLNEYATKPQQLWISDMRENPMLLDRPSLYLPWSEEPIRVRIMYPAVWSHLGETNHFGDVKYFQYRNVMNGRIPETDLSLTRFALLGRHGRLYVLIVVGQTNGAMWVHISEDDSVGEEIRIASMAENLRRDLVQVREMFEIPAGYAWSHLRSEFRFCHQESLETANQRRMIKGSAKTQRGRVEWSYRVFHGADTMRLDLELDEVH